MAARYQVSRDQQEQFALRSQEKVASAITEGRFDDEPIAIETAAGSVAADGCPRPDTTLTGLAELNPVFLNQGAVTVRTSSPLTDGAPAVLVCCGEFASQNGLEPLALIKSVAVAGCEPDVMGMGPVVTSQKALSRANLEASDLDVIELNEAFDSQAIACQCELGLDEQKVNLDGGAIALGHPLGANRGENYGQGCCGFEAGGWALRVSDAVHRWWSGYCDCAGGPVDEFLSSYADDDVLREFVEPLAKAFGRLQRATVRSVREGMKNLEQGAAVASEYLRLFALVASGYMWQRFRRFQFAH